MTTPEIIEWLAREHTRLHAKGFSTFVDSGDWNSHQGNFERHSVDKKPASRQFRDACTLLCAKPALGRTDGTMAATMTSRGPGSDRRDPRDLAEIDGFLVSTNTPQYRLGALQPEDRPRWSEYFVNDGDPGGPQLPGDLTHLPVILDFQPDPAPISRMPLRPKQRPPRPTSYTPIYADKSWADRADANLRYLEGINLMAHDIQYSLEDIFAAINEATSRAAAEVHPWSPHVPTTTYRMFQGSSRPTPSTFVNAADEARHLWRRG